MYVSIYIFYIYLYRTGLSASYGSTVTHAHTSCPADRNWTRNNCTAWNFSVLFVLFFPFVLFPKNAQHLPRSYLYSVTARVKYHLIYKMDLKSLCVLLTVTFTSCKCRCT